MEEDDEFGDLYTDVLIPLTTSSTPHPPPIQTRTIDLNIQSDDEEILFETPNSKQLNFNLSHQNPKTLVFEPVKEPTSIAAGSFDSHRNLNEEVEQKEGLIGLGKRLDESDLPARVLESVGEVKLQERGFENSNFTDERDGKDEILEGRTENLGKFDIEEGNTEIGDMGLEPMFLGLSIPGVSDSVENRGDANFARMGEGSGEGDDWDSDSEDDLQIVLNDNNHGPMVMERSGVVGADEEDDDEDGEPLVIVADNDPNHQAMEEQDWGEDVGQVADGERKELGDAVKVNGGLVQPPKIAFSSHGYHPFHSQFKYVRPGAAPMPGAAPLAPGGVPGQLRPLVNMGPIAGRGRGDWRPAGIKNAPLMQKSFYPGYGMPVWGNNAPGRGLEFTLPSHKTIFEVDIDSFEEKPWKLPGIGISDFFNFDLNEETWKDYCKQLEQLRLEATMQSKIRVYESGRTEQEYDPDMPPELAAATGIHDVSSENANLGREDAGQSDLAKGSARLRPQLPTGRAIQVETGYGERLPSIDTRPPRIRDSDAIIEIVLQGSADDDSFHGNDITELPDIDPSREDLSGGHEIEEDIAQEEGKNFASIPQAYNDRKRELAVRRVPLKNYVQDNVTEGDGISPFLSEAPVPYYPNSRGQTPVYPGRNFSVPHHERTKGRAHDASPQRNPSKSTQDKRFLDNQKEESVESVDDKHSPPLSSPITVGTVEEQDSEPKDVMHDELVLADGNSEMEREEIALDTTTTTGTLKDENLMHSVKKKKLSSQVEQSSPQEICDGEDSKAARSSENSKARSGSSRDTQDLRDAAGEEFVQDGRSTRIGITKRPLSEDEHSVRSKGRDERQEMERHHMSMKGREDSYYRKNWDSNSAHRSHMKIDSIDRRKESDISDGAWQRKDEDPHGGRTRAEDTRKRERGNEMTSRHRSKVRENESSDKHDQLRKQLDNSSWRGHQDKEMGSRQRDRDDNLKTRNENLDVLHSKRKKEEAYFRRDHAEKEVLHVHRESTSHRKRERDDILDQRKRDDQVRPRDDNQHSVRHKEEAWVQRERVERQRERDEWHRLKQSHEESLSKREREEGQGGVRSGRAAEDKAWVGHSRLKDDYKGSDREYHFKDTGRHSEQLKKRDRVDNESLSRHGGSVDVYARGNQLNNEERRSRQERASSRSDHAASASDNHRVPEKKHKESTRKSKESAGDHNSSAPSRRNQEDNSGPISERVRLRGKIEQGSGEHQIPVNRQPSRKHREDASSDDELQDLRRGRSKLERWTSHKEIDFSIGSKSSSLHVKEIDVYKNGGSSLATKLPDESFKRVETVDNSHPLANDKDGGDLEIKNVDAKPTDDRHLDTVAKLKKRSERFKLPMPSEKEAMAIKKMENEPLPSAQTETHADSEIKHERPARKRRWTSN